MARKKRKKEDQPDHSQEQAPQIPEPRIFQPPKGDEMGTLHKVICENEECQHIADIWTAKEAFWLGALAECPLCGADMHCDRSTINITIQAKGAGAHDGTIGDRKKRMMRERSDRLAKKQWENVEPVKIPEGRKPRNPTPGGIYDPNGPFVKKKPKQQIFVPKSS